MKNGLAVTQITSRKRMTLLYCCKKAKPKQQQHHLTHKKSQIELVCVFWKEMVIYRKQKNMV